MGSHGYRRLDGGKVVSWLAWMFSGYKSIYIGKGTRSGELRGAHEGGGVPTPLGVPSCLVAASWRSRLQLEIFWFAFGPKIQLNEHLFVIEFCIYDFFKEILNIFKYIVNILNSYQTLLKVHKN